jgi:hypothetical protein
MRLLYVAFVFLLGFAGEDTNSQQANQWVPPASGAQLSIIANTNTFVLNSTPIIYIRIRSMSTNAIISIEANLMDGLSIWLTNKSGVYYSLEPIGSPSREGSDWSGPISSDIPTDSPCEWSVKLLVHNMQPGYYTLYGQRHVNIRPGHYAPYAIVNVNSQASISATNSEMVELLSNPLNVQIVPEPTNLWGEAVLGAQLSIALNTNVLSAGSKPIVDASIRNLSTNMIYEKNSDVVDGTFIFLTNGTGKNYQLTPIRPPNSEQYLQSRFPRYINANRSHEWSSSLNIDDTIEPGNYICYATRNIYTPDGKDHALKSNFVQVQVK